MSVDLRHTAEGLLVLTISATASVHVWEPPASECAIVTTGAVQEPKPAMLMSGRAYGVTPDDRFPDLIERIQQRDPSFPTHRMRWLVASGVATVTITPDQYPVEIDATPVGVWPRETQVWTIHWWGDLYPDGNPAGITDLLLYLDWWDGGERDIRDLLNYLSEWYAWGGDSQTAARAVRGAME